MIRVREILDQLKGNGRKPLLKFLPEVSLPEESKGLFPNAILSSLNIGAEYKYSYTGVVTEALVLSSTPLTPELILSEFAKLGISFDEKTSNKIKKSKTTKDYIEKILKTREELSTELDCCLNTIQQNQVLSYECVEAHPDGILGETVIEVKTTSKLESDINYFLLQLFSYVCLGNFKKAILVLPLQQTILTFDTSSWAHKKVFKLTLLKKAKDILVKETKKEETAPVLDLMTSISSSLLIQTHNIGTHTAKAKTLLQTVQSMNPRIPYQIFLCSNQSTHISVKDADIALASDYVEKNRIQVYIHSPYLINLSAKTDGDWNLNYMKKLLEYSATLGAKGVVVHTGKHTKDSYTIGVEKMKAAIEAILPSAKPECPLLLETPAGQGTETLQGQDEFLDFVESFKSPNIAVCLDTCHVFANGHDPLTYIHKAFERGLLRLVHYNDSQDCCGSKKDRHAFVGTGKLGLEKMKEIAEFCSEKGIPMVIE